MKFGGAAVSLRVTPLVAAYASSSPRPIVEVPLPHLRGSAPEASPRRVLTWAVHEGSTVLVVFNALLLLRYRDG